MSCHNMSDPQYLNKLMNLPQPANDCCRSNNTAQICFFFCTSIKYVYNLVTKGLPIVLSFIIQFNKLELCTKGVLNMRPFILYFNNIRLLNYNAKKCFYDSFHIFSDDFVNRQCERQMKMITLHWHKLNNTSVLSLKHGCLIELAHSM